MLGQLHASEKILQDAILMAMKKAKAGFPSCSKSRLGLAKQPGTTEEEFRLAIDNASGLAEQDMSRRNFLKLAIGIAAGLAVSLLELLAAPEPAQADDSIWGTDTNTTTCCEIPPNMSMGHQSSGVATGHTSHFNINAVHENKSSKGNNEGVK